MIPVTGPDYPLSRDAFRAALRSGHGRARVHVDRFGARGLEQDILEAATVCLSYDAQVDGLRGAWIADLCEKAGLVQEIVTRPASGGFWDRELRCRLLKEFASRGHEGAREALYASWEPAEGCANVHACDEIVGLDGTDGLLFVARELGRLARDDEQRWIVEEDFAVYDDEHGEGAAMAVLRPLAATDPDIAACVERIDRASRHRAARHDATQQKRLTTMPSSEWVYRHRPAEQVLADILRDDMERPALWHWGSQALPSDLGTILPAIGPDASLRVLRNALRCFANANKGALPLREPYLDLLDHEDDEVRMLCARALGRHGQPRVRALGLKRLSRDLWPALELLHRSARPEDADAIVAALHPVDDADDRHAILSTVLDLLEDGMVSDPRLALAIYEHTPCGNCRFKALLQLGRDACPPWLLEEGAHDAEERIREFCTRAASPPES